MCHPFWQFYKNVVLRLSEHGDVIEMQTVKVCPKQRFLVNLVPGYITCQTISKCQLYSNENSIYPHTHTFKIDVDNHLHNSACGALTVEMRLSKTCLRNHCSEECLSTIAMMILHPDVEVNYEKLV